MRCSLNVRSLRLPNGKIATVSEQDWSRINDIAWSCNREGYVRGRWKQESGGTGAIVYLHRYLLEAPPGMVVDHIDNNPLNNARENLQITTNARNVMRSRSGGITRHKGRWRVRKRVDGTLVSYGLFDSIEEAEKRLQEAMREIWGDPAINKHGTTFRIR